MADIVTPSNEELYRKQFAAVSGHKMQCIEETINTMGKVMAGVCALTELPKHALTEILQNIEVEDFEKHLYAILDSKDCDCKRNENI